MNQELMKSTYESNENQFTNEASKTNFEHNQTQRNGIQFLESLHIMNTTKNLDNLIGRYEFVEKIYERFINASSSQRYLSDAQNAIDEYKTLHYDKILEDFEIELLVEPSRDKLRDFYSECLLNCFDKYREEQLKQIDDLKREDVKQRRRNKIYEIGMQAIEEFENNGSKKDFFISDFKNLKETLNSNYS